MGNLHLQMGGGGGVSGHPDTDMRGKGRSQKNFFSALRASVWSTNKGGGEAPWAPSLDPGWSRHGWVMVGVV